MWANSEHALAAGLLPLPVVNECYLKPSREWGRVRNCKITK